MKNSGMDSKKGEQSNTNNIVNIDGGDSLVTIKDKNWKSLEEAKKEVYNTVLGALTNLQKESKQKVNDLKKSGGLNPKVPAIASTGMELGGDSNPFFLKGIAAGNTDKTSATKNTGISEFPNVGENTQKGIDNLQEFSSGKTNEMAKNPAANKEGGVYITPSGMIDRKRYLVEPEEYDGQGGGGADPDPQNVKSGDKKDTAGGAKKAEPTPAAKQENTTGT